MYRFYERESSIAPEPSQGQAREPDRSVGGRHIGKPTICSSLHHGHTFQGVGQLIRYRCHQPNSYTGGRLLCQSVANW